MADSCQTHREGSAILVLFLKVKNCVHSFEVLLWQAVADLGI